MGIGVPSKYCDFPVASLGTMATVTLKRARRVRPQSTKKERRRWSRGVRRPREKAAAAGETPKETYFDSQHCVPVSCPTGSCPIEKKGRESCISDIRGAYQVGKRVKFLSHKRGLFPPPRDLAVHKVEEQSEWDEGQCPVQVGVVIGVVLDAVTEGREDGHNTAEA